MSPPKPWTPGDPITADRLNETRAESVRPRRDVSLSNASSFVNEAMGNQSANMSRPYLKLVEALEDFDIQKTDLDIATDDVPSGMVRQVRLDRRTGKHGKETIAGPFRVWDVLQGLSDGESKSEGDKFYVAYNEDSKRWEVLGQAVGCETHSILFTIVSANCDQYSGELLSVIATVDSYTCGCSRRPPEMDSYDQVEIFDRCGTLAFFTVAQLESGAKGRATYWYELDAAESYCDGEWKVDDICEVLECL